MRSGIISLSHLLLCVLVAFAFSFNGCSDKCQVKNRFVYYAPVYSTRQEVRAAIAEKPPQTIQAYGKIYFKDGMLFINEPAKGIHIFDNHDPSQPRAVAFLNIPGNLDLAIRGNTLYADNYVDLVAFDIRDIHNIKEVSRIEGLFKNVSAFGFSADATQGILTSWKLQENVSVIEKDCSTPVQYWGGIFYKGGIAMMTDAGGPPQATAAPGLSTGVGGSMARFTILDNYLYGLDGTQLEVVDISAETHPVAGSSVQVSWDAQTLFPYNNHLFVGGRAGMYIFDLASPSQPALLGQYDHIQSCDPVVVEGDYAYVTLYGGDGCHVDTNQLEVISIKDLSAPVLVATYPMVNPHGLGISNGTLFICDGPAGLKVFDASDPLTISSRSLATYSQISAIDIIPFNHTAMVIGNDGISQYDYSDVQHIKWLSTIPVAKP